MRYGKKWMELPEGVHASEEGYAVVNDDWAVCLPNEWVYSVTPDFTGGRPFVSISRMEFQDNGCGPFAYGDHCFTVFRMSPNSPAMSFANTLLNPEPGTVIARDGLSVTYNCYHDEIGTYCQYVIVTTRKATYMSQLFYVDSEMSEQERVDAIEIILQTICLAYEVPTSQRNTPERKVPIEYINNTKVKNQSRKGKKQTQDEWEVFTTKGSTLSRCYRNIPYIVTPPGIKKIEDYAFTYCQDLEVLVLSEGIQSWGQDTFYYLKKLHTVILPQTIMNCTPFVRQV